MTSFAFRRYRRSQSAFVTCRKFEFRRLAEDHTLPRQTQIVRCLHSVAVPFLTDDEKQSHIAFGDFLSIVKLLNCGDLSCDAALRISGSSAPYLVSSALIRVLNFRGGPLKGLTAAKHHSWEIIKTPDSSL